jgi:lysophospholipase L1-like esterase
MTHKLLLILVSLSLFIFTDVPLAAAQPEKIIRDGDHIVFIGDSITAQGALGGKQAWLALFGEGLALVRPTAQPVLLGLGGSGSTVGHWLSVEKRSRSEATTLDDKKRDIGQTLDAQVDIVVIMLGMNDVLSPSLQGTSESFATWMQQYAALVEAVRIRSHPRVIALATVTPCTEDSDAPKNKALAEMNLRLRQFAEQNKYVVLPTSESAFEMLQVGRLAQPDFHVTGDFVHPNGAGHVAIAVGMLRGLGEAAAAEQLLSKYAGQYRPAPDTLPRLSYTLKQLAGSADDDVQNMVLHYNWTATNNSTTPTVTLALPPGWKANTLTTTAADGEFRLSGPLDRAENTITLTATCENEVRKQTVVIPPGWRVATGRGQVLGWVQNSKYDPTKDIHPRDEQLINGEGFTSPVSFATGETADWKRVIASNNYTGLNQTGSIDMAGVVFFSHGQQVYGARWIYSERARPVQLDLSSQIFAGTWSLGVWLNDSAVYAGKLVDEPGRKITVPTTLKPGWNRLLFKSTFIQWQWQFSVGLRGLETDDLSDLRYATKPPTP